ncbi:hypothetical protein [Streptomyces sp. ERV7]|uniref:hypothetical protein n=1 Tax=Streptomyces sp. ERV7 TaxID=1322334 RepID=UPI000AE1B246|nr:hypothetical protein [Streptomyces sp. ERV7]
MIPAESIATELTDWIARTCGAAVALLRHEGRNGGTNTKIKIITRLLYSRAGGTASCASPSCSTDTGTINAYEIIEEPTSGQSRLLGPGR